MPDGAFSAYKFLSRQSGNQIGFGLLCRNGTGLLTERHADQIAGVLSCYDRILIQPRFASMRRKN